MKPRTVVRAILMTLGVGALVGLGVALWPDVEALLTVGAAITVIAGYMALISWSQRRRRRGDEGSTSNAEGAEVINGGWFGGGPL